MKTVLCPTDFSKNSANAAEYAAAFCMRFHAALVLLHVYETPAVFSEMDFTSFGSIEAAIQDTAKKKIMALKNRLQKKYRDISIDMRIVPGSAAKEVIEFADTLQADMIIIGTTGMSKMERLLMGSTTANVVQHAGCPVLCIPKNAKHAVIRKIVFATDLHEDNIAVASSLVPFAKKFDAQIIFVFVDDRHLVHEETEVVDMTKKIRTRVKYPKIEGYISKNTSITSGLEYFLKKHPADVLAMYTHKRNFPQTLFNQSLTKIMSNQTSIPLLALRLTEKAVL